MPPLDHPFIVRAPRFSVRLDVVATFNTANGRKAVSGHGYEISRNGMALFLPMQLEVGTPLELAISIPRGQVLRLEGEVRNQQPTSHGVAFTSNSAAALKARELLAKYCAVVVASSQPHWERNR